MYHDGFLYNSKCFIYTHSAGQKNCTNDGIMGEFLGDNRTSGCFEQVSFESPED